MANEHSRRRFLGTGLAVGMGAGVSGWTRRPTDRQEDLPNELRIESDGGGFAAYEFTVSGDLEQVDDDDQVDGSRAWGHVGPERGTDTFRYSGELDGIALAGPATPFRNDNRIQLSGFPHPEGSLTSANFDATAETNVLRIESDGGGVAAYEFAVTGDVSQRDDDDQVGGNWAWGHVGPDRGTDEFEFTGQVGRFALAGPASVFLNGSAVTPDSGGSDRGLLRANPDREVTAVTDTTLLFEAVAPDHPSEFLNTDWYVDGQEIVGPGTFHGQLGGRGRATLTYPFDSAGSHEVHVDAYERETDGERGDYVGTTDWLVEVGEEGNRPPEVELIAPDSPVSVSEPPAATERRTFEVAVSDPEGELDRVAWWETQCDYLVAVSSVEGESDETALSLAPSQGCPLGAWAIDRDGAVSELRNWSYESDD